MDDNNGENTSHIEMTIEAQKKDAENVENQAKREKEADDALAKETSEEVQKAEREKREQEAKEKADKEKKEEEDKK